MMFTDAPLFSSSKKLRYYLRVKETVESVEASPVFCEVPLEREKLVPEESEDKVPERLDSE